MAIRVCEDCGKALNDSESTALAAYAHETLGSVYCDSCTRAYHVEVVEAFEKSESEVSTPSGLVSPLRTIRLHCLDCGGTANEVKLCPVTQCKLWPFRFGTNPNRAKRELSEEEREKLRTRLAESKKRALSKENGGKE